MYIDTFLTINAENSFQQVATYINKSEFYFCFVSPVAADSNLIISNNKLFMHEYEAIPTYYQKRILPFIRGSNREKGFQQLEYYKGIIRGVILSNKNLLNVEMQSIISWVNKHASNLIIMFDVNETVSFDKIKDYLRLTQMFSNLNFILHNLILLNENDLVKISSFIRNHRYSNLLIDTSEIKKVEDVKKLVINPDKIAAFPRLVYSSNIPLQKPGFIKDCIDSVGFSMQDKQRINTTNALNLICM